jgi:hypothetical protein
MYFSVAAVSVLLNFATVFSYKFGVEKANVASWITSTFSWVCYARILIFTQWFVLTCYARSS